MKTPGTMFRVVVNHESFASGVIDVSGHFEITLVNRPGQDGVVLAVTASTSSDPTQSAHNRTETKTLSVGDAVAITLEEVRSGISPQLAFRSWGMAENPKHDASMFCSFCGKEKLKAQKMVSGPNVFICDQCVEMCHEIVHET